MKRRVRSLIKYSLLAAGITASGSALAIPPGQPGNEPPGSVEPPGQPCPAARTRSLGGMLGPVVVVLDQIALRPEQRTQIDQIVGEAARRDAAFGDAHRDFMVALAEQIQTGQLNREALAPKIDTLTKAATQARAGDLAALEALQGVLDDKQRAQVVKALEAGEKPHGVAPPPQGAEGSQGVPAQGAQGPQEGAQAPHKGAPQAGSWSDDFAQHVGLTDGQKAKLRSIMEQRRRERRTQPTSTAGGARPAQLMEAFRNGKLRAADVGAADQARTQLTAALDDMLGFTEQVIVILTPEQRGRLAESMRAKATGTGLSPTGPQAAPGGTPSPSGAVDEEADDDDASTTDSSTTDESADEGVASTEQEQRGGGHGHGGYGHGGYGHGGYGHGGYGRGGYGRGGYGGYGRGYGGYGRGYGGYGRGYGYGDRYGRGYGYGDRYGRGYGYGGYGEFPGYGYGGYGRRYGEGRYGRGFGPGYGLGGYGYGDFEPYADYGYEYPYGDEYEYPYGDEYRSYPPYGW